MSEHYALPRSEQRISNFAAWAAEHGQRIEQTARTMAEREAEAMTQEETKTPEVMAPAVANIFARKDGFKVHFQLPSKPTAIVGNVNLLLERLVSDGYEADPMGNAPGNSQGGRGASQQNGGGGKPAPPCNDCNGDVYDNRGRKRSPQGPDFTCKDKQGCGAVAWIRDGSLQWSKSKAFTSASDGGSW